MPTIKLFAFLLVCTLLPGCAFHKNEISSVDQSSSLPAGPNVQVDWSVLDKEEALPAVGERWYQNNTPELIPGQDYGLLLPFAGAQGQMKAWWEESETAYTSTWFYGLMTQQGVLVMDPVCSSISRPGYTISDPITGELITQSLPVYALTKGDPERGASGSGELIALAAEDGSWYTGFRFWGTVAYPGGIAAGDGKYLTLLDPQTGAEIAHYTWAELGIPDGSHIPWFTGDASSSAQWTGETLFLGIFGEAEEFAHFLDPATGKVTSCEAADWYRQWEEHYNQYIWWTPHANADGTVTLTLGPHSYTLPSPLPQDEYPAVVGGDRVCFSIWDQENTTFAVTDLEGNVLLPVQQGELIILNGKPNNDLLLFAIRKEQEWLLYDQDGRKQYALPGGEDSWCYLQESLVEIIQNGCASYYQAKTGECIRRTYTQLEDRGPDL